jgi:nitrate/TMAO reductase-like tetraheme cytochrome c subunit
LFAALIGLVFAASSVEAYYLDAPHNESNGIYCYTCHSMSYWNNPPSGGIDVTIRNSVCLQCHAEGATDPKRGPTKKLHSSSTSSTKFGTWTTECTQCHDVHAQGQLDWAATEPGVYLATGLLANGGLWVPKDLVDSPIYGSTRFNISGVTGQAGWTDTATWVTKGGKVDSSRAADGSRGLIFVPNIANPNESYEIISASPTVIKVKGRVATTALTGKTFGVIYGQSLKSAVLPNGATTSAEVRNVMFFQPAVLSGTYGGFVDQTPALTQPTGLCQVCHTAATNVWTNDGGAQTHHTNEDCSTCHNVPKGFTPTPNHAFFIADRLGSGCNTCHSNKIASPESTHASCDICHTAARPEINTVAMLNDSGTVLANLQSKGYAGGTTGVRITYSGRGIADPLFQKIDCGDCHLLKPAAVGGGSHGGHSASSFAWDGNCNECHSGAKIVEDVHNTAVNGCTICHVSASGGARKVGNAANGIDGDATLGTASSACSVCHTAINTAGTIHHDTKNNYAANGNCAYCHKVSSTGGSVVGNHIGNHTSTVATDANCVPCHAANVGSSNGAPVDGAVVVNKIHDTCVSCHTTGGILKTKAEVGGSKVVAMPAGGSAGNDGGGNCTACHGVYFANHTHNHAATVTTTTLCGSCHTGNTVSNASTHSNRCADCHNLSTGARVNGGANVASYGGMLTNVGDATVNGGVGGTCATCHATYFNAHSHGHAFTVTAACATCHGNPTPGTSIARDAIAAPYTTTGEVHAASGCATCHDLATNGALKGSALGKQLAAGCVDCHAGTWTAVHTAATGVTHATLVRTTTGACEACHGAPTPASSDARDAQTSPYAVAGEVHATNGCATCHNATGGLNAGPFTKASTIARGTCATCHTSTWTATHTAKTGVSHATRVDGLAACTTTCHTATAGGVTGLMPVNASDNKVHDSCATCHVASGTLLTTVAANVNGWLLTGTMAKGDCGTCHTATYFNNHTHHVAANDVRFDGGANDKTLGGTACNICHGSDGGDAGTVALDSWSEIFALHAGSCGKCHDYNGTNGVKNITPAADVTNAIFGPGPATCVSCHTDKDGPLAHGSHTATEFAWTPVTRASCGDDGRLAGACHADGVNSDVIGQVHKGNCALCHVDEPNHNYTRIVGAPATHDGNPADPLAVAAKRNSVCTDCHTTANFPIAFIHHRNDGSVVFNPNTYCATCHSTANSAAGNHTSLVANAAEIPGIQKACNTCHTGTAGTTNNVPVNAGDDKVHDACTQCHVINSTTKVVELVTPSGSVTTMNNPDGTTSTSNGGGTCTACHTGYFEAHSHHDTGLNQIALKTSNPNPDKSWAAAVSCGDFAQGCHTDYTGDSTSLNTWTGIKWEHDRTDGTKDGVGSCYTCHMSTKATSDIWNYTNIQDVIANGVSVQCLNCHKQKETPNGHGMMYIDHFIQNTVQGSLGYAPLMDPSTAGTAECLVCHATDLVTNGGPDVIVDLHNGSCTACHTNQPFLNDGSAGTPDLNNRAGLGGYVCTDCHNDSNNTNFSFPFHGMDPGHSQTSARHDKAASSTGTPYNCLACHSEMTPGVSDILNRHMPGFTNQNDCLVCHTGGATTAQTVVNAGSTAGGNTVQYCESCHAGKGTYRMHGLDLAGVSVEHNNLSTAGVGGNSDCANCHAIGTVTARLTAHLTPKETSHSGGCLPCHIASNPASAAIDSGLPVANDGYPYGSNIPQTCVSCHTGSGVHLMHGLDNASTSAAHDRLAVSVNAGSGTASDCAACHSMATAANRLALHLDCLACHNEATTPATTVIANGWKNVAPVTANCESCHAAKGTYLMHGVTDATMATEHNNIVSAGPALVGTNADCANCHAMATRLQMLNIHSNPVKTASTGGCMDCHNAGGTAQAVINDGMSLSAGGNNNAKYCNDCHVAKGSYLMHGLTDDAGLDGVVNEHERMTVQSVGSTSACNTCHAAGTVLTRVQLHTRGAVGPATCRTCHELGNATVKTVIANGFNNSANAECDDCHTAIGGSWFSHLDPDHTATGLNVIQANTATTPKSANCVSCHNQADLVSGLHNSVAPAASPNACAVCHDPDGTLRGGSSADNYTAGGPADECVSCHTGGFTSHSHVHDVVQGAGDLSGGALCRTCHLDNSDGAAPPLNSWTDIMGEHVTGCTRCHDYTNADGKNTPTVAANDAGIASATTVNCLTCHTEKTVGHGGHSASHFAWTAGTTASCGASACHNATANANVVASLHSNSCAMCHPTTGGRDGGKLGANQTGDSRLATTAFGSAGLLADDCTVCHTVLVAVSGSAQNRNYPSNFGTAHRRLTDHDGVSNMTNNSCESCHTASTGPTIIANVHLGCTSCHNNVTTNGSLILGPSGGNGGTVGDARGGSGNCASCHTSPVNYPANYANHAIKDHSVITAPGTASCSTSVGCHNAATVTTIVNTLHTACDSCHTAVTGKLVAAPYGKASNAAKSVCLDCHGETAANYSNYANHAVKDHSGLRNNTATTPKTKNCVNCHTGSMAAASGVHDLYADSKTSCQQCHADTTGVLLSGATGSATVADGGIAADGQKECGECHAAWYSNFANHTHVHNTSMSGSDLSGGAACNTCHLDNSDGTGNPLSSWTDIMGEHVTGCSRCHDYTNADAQNTPPVAANDAAIASAGPVYCLTCHTANSSQAHAMVDHNALGYVKFAATSAETCANCHSGDSVVEVHKNKCSLCHSSGSSLKPGALHRWIDATGAVDTPADIPGAPKSSRTCATCHDAFTSSTGRYKTWEHHYNDNAQAGNCVHCHADVRKNTNVSAWTTGIAVTTMPKQTPCAYCHINYTRLDSDGGWELKTFDFAAAGFNNPINSTLSATHTIPNAAGGAASPVKIHDFSVCFTCHDRTDMFNGFAFGAPATAPPMVRPFHAVGVTQAANLGGTLTARSGNYTLTAGNLANPGTTKPQVPLNFANLYNENTYEKTGVAADCSGGTLTGAKLYDNQTATQTCKEDFHFAYYYHPGRGGITDTTSVIMGAGKPKGSFNVLFKWMSPYWNYITDGSIASPKFYGTGKSESGVNPKNAYKLAGLDLVNGSDNYAACNSSYTDSGGRVWNFCNKLNVPFNDFNRTTYPNGYWVTVPSFADIVAPSVPDVVRITKVDCAGTPKVSAWTSLTTDYHLGATTAGKVTVKIGAGAAQNMTWNGTTSRWESNATCSAGQSVLVTSILSGGGSDSTTAQ